MNPYENLWQKYYKKRRLAGFGAFGSNVVIPIFVHFNA